MQDAYTSPTGKMLPSEHSHWYLQTLAQSLCPKKKFSAFPTNIKKVLIG